MKIYRNMLAALLCLALLAGLGPSASAERLFETETPAAPREIPETLYIGLSFGERAVTEVVLKNTEGLGFCLGRMDEERHFVEEDRVASPLLRIRQETLWYFLSDAAYATEQEAIASAGRGFAKAVEVDGRWHGAYGPYQTVGEVMALLRQGAVGKAHAERSLVVFGERGRERIYPDAAELAVQAISEKEAATSYRGREYRGAFVLRCGEDGRFTVVNAVALEHYVKGVVPYEMSSGWPVEALKAQAICARTYGAYHVGAYAEEGFDLTDDTECQVYRGLGGAREDTDAAVDATAGLFVRYEGALCEIYYFSSDGGATEDGLNIFGSDQPYLKGKKDPYEAAMDKFVLRWERRFTGAYISQRLNDLGYELGPVTRIEPSYSKNGNVIAVSYYDQSGAAAELQYRDSYSFLALDSARFTVKNEGGLFVFTGVGWGHNCGMSQWGAYAMAASYGKTAEEIIEFYFTGAAVG